MQRRLSRQRGVTLIEVMMAVLIFSLGLIGLAALLVMSTKSNQTAYQRTQATFLAQSMADRMQANPMGLWAGSYNGAYPVAGTSSCATGCTPAQLAAYDQQIWSSQLNTFLPAPIANIDCTNMGLTYVPSGAQQQLRPPYGGSCVMHINWTEQGAGNQGPVAQSFTWTFQP